jgi:hypothetical protein
MWEPPAPSAAPEGGRWGSTKQRRKWSLTEDRVLSGGDMAGCPELGQSPANHLPTACVHREPAGRPTVTLYVGSRGWRILCCGIW